MMNLMASYCAPVRNGSNRPLPLTAYKVNLLAAIAMTDIPSARVSIDGDIFESPIVRIDFPGGDEDGISLYVSGVADELLARWRDAKLGGF